MSRSSKSRRDRRRRERRALADETVLTHQRTTLDETLLGGALPTIVADQVLDAPGVRHDADVRLATGISVKQLVQQAELWWQRKGRKQFGGMRRSQVKSVRGHRSYNGPMTLDPDDPNFLPSGIMHGQPWDKLSRTEKLQICKAYHEIRYARPWRETESGLLLPGVTIN